MLPKTVKMLRNKPHVGAGTSWMVHSQCGAVSLNGQAGPLWDVILRAPGRECRRGIQARQGVDYG
ncbi:hypothetical protein IG631_06903 [Alternaria alternata]|nr:hypothetical protein IG631_06903 [Alternaria alternata]